MKILVTGALGRVGEHLVKRFKEQHEVLSTDLLVGYNDGYSRVDVTDRTSIDEVMEAWCPQVTIHMAGEVGRLNGELHPERMLTVNALGAMNVARSCIEHKVRLINFSTSEVYGESFDWAGAVRETERLDALGTSNIYALSKLTGEAVVKHYVDNYGLKAITVRPFMLYGEGEIPSKYRSALTNFVWATLNRKQFDVHKNTARAWCYVSDFVDGLSLLLDFDSAGYEAFNIGSEEYHSMEEVALMVCEETGAPQSLMNLVEYPGKFGSAIKVASIDKIKALGYSPKVSVQEGIRRVVKWQRDNLLG